MGTTIRPLAAADVAPLAAGLARLPLLQRYRRGEPQLAADLAAALARGDGLLVAEQEGAPAGLCWYLPRGTLAMGGYLRLMAVLDGTQRRGVGAALLEAFEAAVAREGPHAFLLVSDFNAPAQAFYARHGWTQVGRLPRLVLPDVDELLWWKRVRP